MQACLRHTAVRVKAARNANDAAQCRYSRVADLMCRRLRQELGIREESIGAEATRLRLLEENKRTREEQDAARRRNPILVYVEKLAAADESAWQDNLEAMGNTPDIPKLFRHAGKVFLPFKRLHKRFWDFTCRLSGC